MANQTSTPFDQGLFLVHLNRGREHFDRRNFVDAAEELEEARRLRPDDDSVLNLLGLAYFKQEKYREADAVYRKLIELNPESYTLHFNLGLVCFKTGDLDNAEAIFFRALELKPDNQKTHFYLGNIYEKKGQFYNAIFQYRKAGANIMVKRVQERIDQERPLDPPPGLGPAETAPSPDDTRPSKPITGDGRKRVAVQPPHSVDRITVDTIDRRRFLTALQEASSTETPPPSEAVTPASEAIASDVVPSETAAIPVKEIDTQEEVLTAEERATIAESIEPAPPDATSARTDDTIPPPRSGTRLRVTERLDQDESLSEISRDKVPSEASADLFTERRRGQGRGAPRFDIPPVEHFNIGDTDAHGQPQRIIWSGATSGAPSEPNVYARMRRRDDIFRYLENNLMEVNFSGKVFIKQGTICSYSGNLTFWVKPQREETVQPLVIVSGTGKLLLTDRQRDITVMRIEDEAIFVEPSHLLACQETLTPRYAVIEKDGGGTSNLHVILIKGTGVLALSVATNPLLLTVQKEYPVNVSSSSLISWSGELSPAIVEDEALAEIMLPGPSRGVNLRLEGEGRVLMEKSSSR